jgi:hypothetical protein
MVQSQHTRQPSVLMAMQDSRRRNVSAEKRHIDPEDVYVKQEKIGAFCHLECGAHCYRRSRELWQRLQGVRVGLFTVSDRRYHKETHETVAIKVIDLDYAEDDVDDIMKEIAILAQLNSKYVTRS